MSKIFLALVTTFLLIFAVCSPVLAIPDLEEGPNTNQLPVNNSSFETWTTDYDGYAIPEGWKILRSKNPANNVQFSLDSYLGAKSLRLTNSSGGSEIFDIKPDSKLSLNVKLIARVKSQNNTTSSPGSIGLYTFTLSEICRLNFNIPASTTNWTKLGTTCKIPEDFKNGGRVYITLSSDVHNSLLFDNIKLVQLP